MLGYNKMTGYNIARYNADGSEIFKADSFSIVDNTALKNISKRLTDLITTAEATAKQQDKQVADTIKLDVWQQQERTDAIKWKD